MGRTQANFLFKNFSSAQTLQLASGVGTLHSIILGSTSAAASAPIAIVDGLGGTTATIATLRAGVVEGTYLYDCCFGLGLRVVAPSDANFTVTWNSGS